MNRTIQTVFVASALTVFSTALVTPPSLAAPQDKPGKMMAGKMADKNHEGVSACEKCKTYTTPAAARKMGNKDAMGHMLVKMDKAPAGYKAAPMMDGKMKMKNKMGADNKMKMSGKDATGHPMKKAPAGSMDTPKMKGKM